MTILCITFRSSRILPSHEYASKISYIFSSMLLNWGADFKVYDIVPDKYDLIKNAALKAADECDIVLINAGSSAGRDDYTSSVIRELGEVLFHGISIKPGKPAILGVIQHKPEIGRASCRERV